MAYVLRLDRPGNDLAKKLENVSIHDNKLASFRGGSGCLRVMIHGTGDSGSGDGMDARPGKFDPGPTDHKSYFGVVRDLEEQLKGQVFQT